MESNQVAESHDSKPLHPENTQNQESFGVQGSMSVAPPGLQSIDPQKTPFREQDGNQSPSMRANGQNFDNSLPQPLVPDHRLPGGLNEKRHQPLQPITNDSLGLGYNALITSQNAGENQQPGESLDPFQQPYLEAEKDNNQYFTSNKDAVQASLPGVVTGNLQSKTNQVPESTRMQQNQGISSPTTAGQKTSNQTLSVLLQIDGNKMMINKAPLKFIEDDEEAEEVQVLPILKFIVKKGQRIEGKITHLVKGDDDQAQLPTLIGIYNSTDAAQTTIGEDASVSLSEMEQVGKKYRLNLVVESQSQPSKPKTTNMPAPYSKPTNTNANNTKTGNGEIDLSLPQMGTESQMLNAVEETAAPMKRVRATKQQVADRRKQDADMTPEEEDEVSEPGPLEVEGNGHQDVKLEDCEDENASEYESDGGDEDNDSYEDGKKRNPNLKTKRGGVLLGKSKQAVNQQARNNSSSGGNKKWTTVKTDTKPAERQNRRTKERSITEIIEKVSTWRKLYNGVMVTGPDGRQQLQRWSLEDAAEKVGVSKKSLDDYLLQLRFGKKFNFDFESNRNNKVGVLRTFVKEKKKAKKEAEQAEKKGLSGSQSTMSKRKGKK